MPVETTAMREFGDLTDGRVTLTAEGVALPADSDRRRAVVDALGEQLGSVLLESYDVAPRSIQGSTGYHYHQVSDACPACGTRLRLTQSYLDAENGAQARAQCPSSDCAWTGRAIYRLVDLEGGQGDAVESAVLTGATEPQAVPY